MNGDRMNMTLRILDVSTGHLRPSTRELLSNAPLDDIPLALVRGPYGFMIWSGGEDRGSSSHDGLPSELAAILNTDMPGIEYIRFYSDAERHERFDWYSDSEFLEEPGDTKAPVDNGKGRTAPRLALGETIRVETAGATIEISRLIEGDAVRVCIYPEGRPDSDPTDIADLSMPPEADAEDSPSI